MMYAAFHKSLHTPGTTYMIHTLEDDQIGPIPR